MLLKNKKMNLILIIIISIFTLSTAALAVSYNNLGINIGVNTNNKQEIKTDDRQNIDSQTTDKQENVKILEMDDNDIANALANTYGKTRKEILALKTNLKSWEKVQKELDKFKQSLVLKQDRIIELVNSGYKLQDIDKAGELALLYGIPPEDILKMRVNKTINEETKKEVVIENTWDDVRWELDVKKSLHLADIDTTLYKKIENKSKEQKINKIESGIKSESNTKEDLFAKSKISDKDISLCNKYSVKDDMGYIYAKNLARQFNVSLEKVLQLKKENRDWNMVRNELEVSADEN